MDEVERLRDTARTTCDCITVLDGICQSAGAVGVFKRAPGDCKRRWLDLKEIMNKIRPLLYNHDDGDDDELGDNAVYSRLKRTLRHNPGIPMPSSYNGHCCHDRREVWSRADTNGKCATNRDNL